MEEFLQLPQQLLLTVTKKDDWYDKVLKVIGMVQMSNLVLYIAKTSAKTYSRCYCDGMKFICEH